MSGDVSLGGISIVKQFVTSSTTLYRCRLYMCFYSGCFRTQLKPCNNLSPLKENMFLKTHLSSMNRSLDYTSKTYITLQKGEFMKRNLKETMLFHQGGRYAIA